MALYVHVHMYTPPWAIRSGFDGKAVVQTNAPELAPQLPAEFKLPVVGDQRFNADGAAVKARPEIAPLGEKPRSTEPIRSFAELVAPVMVIVSVADVDVMSNLYVAAGQLVPAVPQFERVSDPIVSAFATPVKMKQHVSVTTALIHSFFKLPPGRHLRRRFAGLDQCNRHSKTRKSERILPTSLTLIIKGLQ